MAEQNSMLKIISDLNVISKLTAGKTLSTTSMQIIDHGSWSGALWRRYNGEKRSITVDKIRDILNDAMFALEMATSTSSELETSLEGALIGFTTLIDTYDGDYHTQVKVQGALDSIRARLTALKSPVLDTQTTELIAQVVQEQLQVAATITTPTITTPTITIPAAEVTESSQINDEEIIVDNDSVTHNVKYSTANTNEPFRLCARADSTQRSEVESQQGPTIVPPKSSLRATPGRTATVSAPATPAAGAKLFKLSKELDSETLVEASDRTSDQGTNSPSIVSSHAGRSAKSSSSLSGSGAGRVNKDFKDAWESRSRRSNNLHERNERLQRLGHSTRSSAPTSSNSTRYVHTEDLKK